MDALITKWGTGVAEALMVAASVGAKRYLRQAGVAITDSGRLADLMVEELRAAIPSALDEALEATELGMVEVATAGFSAAGMQAGIAAAKRYAEGGAA
jgi:hypothetical protein